MFDLTQILPEFLNLIGWRQNTNPKTWELTGLVTSESGLYYNDAHPGLSFANIESIAPKFEQFHTTENAINQAFTAWLQQKTEAAITETLNNWLHTKFENRTANNLLSSNLLFNTTGSITDLETSTGKIVGIQIDSKFQRSLALEIKKIGLRFDQDQTITIKLFKSGDVSATQTKEIVYNGTGAVQWETLNWKLDGLSTYWVVYNQDSITGSAINGVKNYSLHNNGYTKQPDSKFLTYSAINVATDDFVDLWDLSKTTYTVSTNYGINLDLSLKCDYTNFIIQQKELFQTAIWYQTAIALLKEMMFNPQSNVNRNVANISNQDIMYEIEGDTQGNNGSSLIAKYNKAIAGIQFDTTNIESICLACRKRGVRHKTIRW